MAFQTSYEAVGGGVIKVFLHHMNQRVLKPVTFAEAIGLYSSSREFSRAVVTVMKEAEMKAFFWEHPPLSAATREADYEFILAPAPSLEGITANSKAFDEHLTGLGGAPSAFTNLGGDSLLVAPSVMPGTEESSYAHIGSFVHGAPEEQVLALMQAVGQKIERCCEKVGHAPIYVSTSGLGVPWLHVRLDPRPKYYTHMPYKTLDMMRLSK